MFFYYCLQAAASKVGKSKTETKSSLAELNPWPAYIQVHFVKNYVNTKKNIKIFYFFRKELFSGTN